MSLIPSMLGELTAMCISDIPFFMDICTSACGGLIPLFGPPANFIINQIMKPLLSMVFPGVFGG
ncbi:MAG: hypothetical protein MASP_00535 [Candidatus Methanolliviera sp. GoM_asphalt]|nr:MAG: hypothetical protein MASP_00535 [Candidatus Methanolliviera sp. GoM_asphalt]